MKNFYSLIALILVCSVSMQAQGQDIMAAQEHDIIISNASHFVGGNVWRSKANATLGFDIPEFEGNPTDFTGDGVSEIVTTVQEGNALTMKVGTLNPDTILFSINLSLLRLELATSTSLTEEDLENLNFRGFYNFLPKTTENPAGKVLLFTPGDYPVLMDPSSKEIECLCDQTLLAVSDLFDDDIPELIVRNQSDNSIEILISAVDPKN